MANAAASCAAAKAVTTVDAAAHNVRGISAHSDKSSSSGSVSASPIKLRTARPSARALSQVKQTPHFPGMFHHVSMFEGEHVYNYGRHTFTIFKESIAMSIIPAGCLIAYIVTHLPNFPIIPFEFQCLYLVALFAVSRVVAAGWRNRQVKDLTGRHVVVTGGTSGIGRATAAQLAQMGAHVTLLARDSPHAQPAVDFVRRHAKDAAAQEICFHALDLEDFILVRDYCKRARRRQVPIDVLVNAAGRMQQHHVVTRFGDDVLLAANFLGPYLLTEGLLPLVEAAHGRIVYVACSAHVGVKGKVVSTYLSGRGVWSPRVAGKFDGLEQYGFTKLGNIFHAQQLALRSYPESSKGSRASRLTRQQPMTAAGGSHYSAGTGTSRRSGYEDAAAAVAATDTSSGKSNSHDPSTPAQVSIEPRFTACVCSPGGVITNLYRDVPLAGSFKYLYYLYALVMRTAWEGSQTVVNCCVRGGVKNGGYYMNTKYQPAGLSKTACSVTEREQVMTWTSNKMKAYMKWD
ncbi:putative mitochondrial beta-ketoacyl-ACP reductase 2 [Leptomonas pyrrhocoris]|uniref:Putative mitochondrial beta-ketoacyl-ACP reductase 2 n=1 Tax=Leptomonas pyrrhocoris TaxID=157538 RepID=A0A0M9FZS5_LEPPY|nr:putative mitochondrial beta-ketoacyl-ACP reductase 2 [Leptomonas pyrrhocoris]KPA79279.1 putative mitochondrial beta-ketoacyl-ACP reductase 2 [Leptomonas pyrrhocoris]|eukprot:XP_015657718.1 putative mitochondrial beta-ketoacyl-ACP reductase 2 [Leptomonas pyrrhocoris]